MVLKSEVFSYRATVWFLSEEGESSGQVEVGIVQKGQYEINPCVYIKENI